MKLGKNTSWFAQASKLARLTLLGLIIGLTALAKSAAAAPAVFVVGEAVLPATSNNSFTRIDFPATFAGPPAAPPNVFAMTTLAGGDPCVIRIQNVDNTGFEAVCYEPVNEDGAHPGMTFEYVAVANGTTDVPIANSSDSLTFESNCINTDEQTYSNNCDNCAGPTGTVDVNFANTFSGAPALLTAIQTANNTGAGGEPVFIDTATSNVTAADFDLSIDRLEAGVGALTTTERVCYLAAEQSACTQLDFSSFGGPASLTFNSVNTGRVVDGFTNGCSSGEGATFANGCFSSTPIAIASSISRAGIDGHVLRRCSVNAAEITLTADEDQISDPDRQHTTEAISAFAFSETFTTPVTLNRASVNIFGRKALFEWQTSAESFHLGFNLWGEQNGAWVQLNNRLIPGGGKATAGVREYQKTVRLKREQFDEISAFGISTVDTAGFEEFYGPFQDGEDYGELAINEPIDWQEQRTLFDQRLKDLGYLKFNGRIVKTNARRAERSIEQQYSASKSVANFEPSSSGMQLINAATLLAVLPNWRGKPINRLALTLNGEARPRHIVSKDSFLSDDDQIYFVATEPDGADAIYLRHYNYQLRLSTSLARPAQIAEGDPLSVTAIAGDHGLFSQQLTQTRAYSAALNNGDPWYDAELFTTGNPVSKVYSFALPEDTLSNQPATLNVSLFGSINLPGSPDHHVQIRVNGNLVYELDFDGIGEQQIALELEKGILLAGDNTLTITLPGDTANGVDIVLIDKIQLQYTNLLSGADLFEFQVAADSQIVQVTPNSLSAEFSPVFAWQKNGALVVMQGATRAPDGVLLFKPLEQSDNSFYTVAVATAWNPIQNISASVPVLQHEVESDLLVIAHPTLMGEELDEYLAEKSQNGLRVRQLNWLDIVETYGFGNATPAALDRFLELNNEFAPLDNLLIVGGHSWDYLNVSGQNTINLIPTHYHPIGIFGHAPTDNAYADLNGDNIPELSVGRWPARNQTDLTTIIEKSKRWSAKASEENFLDAVLLTQQLDGRGLDFDQQMLGRVTAPLLQTGLLGSKNLISMQELLDSEVDEPILTARRMLNESIEAGADLVSFAGHASTSAWGYQSIVNTEFIQSLQNHNNPLVVMPLACYTTYYESPSINTLAHQWLFAGSQGAAAIHGASVLGEYRENAIFAERFIRNSKDIKTLGGAIKAAKLEMSANNPMLHNWALLGDPTLPLH